MSNPLFGPIKSGKLAGSKQIPMEKLEASMIAHKSKGGTIEQDAHYFGEDRYWKNSAGKLHREDGPAFESVGENPQGYRTKYYRLRFYDETGDSDQAAWKWYQNGVLHRDDGPAVRRMNGDKEWYQNGVLYRKVGSATEKASER